MLWERIEEHWFQLHQKASDKWSSVNPETLALTHGRREEVSKALRSAYRYNERRVEKEIINFAKLCRSRTHCLYGPDSISC